MLKVDKSLAMNYGESAPLSVSGRVDSPEESFPTIHYSGDEEIKIPAHGNMLVHYAVTRVVQTTTKAGERYECDIQIKRVISAEPEVNEPSKRLDEAGDALDKLAAERMAEDDGDEEEND
jgi:hypothetical protein